MSHEWNERLVDECVTYSLIKDGKYYVIENVPARINVETGETVYAWEVAERLEQIVNSDEPPTRLAEARVYKFAPQPAEAVGAHA